MSYNPYKRLIGLLPSRPLQVGDVVAVDGGVATIELPGGGLAQARGDVAVNDRVYFRDGVIEGPAPTLTYVSATV
jgi:hypothetical protein